MNSTQTPYTVEGPAEDRTYHEGPSAAQGDVRIHSRFVTYKNGVGLVAGTNLCVMCTIERPARAIWPYFKDFNLWQPRHYYSGVLGDLEGKTCHLSFEANDPARNNPIRHQYVVQRVIPEYTIVLHQPVPNPRYLRLPGLGGVSGGYHVFTLNEHDGRTTLTGLMNHESIMAPLSSQPPMTDEEAIAPWNGPKAAQEWVRKWRDDFFPTLKKLVYSA